MFSSRICKGNNKTFALKLIAVPKILCKDGKASSILFKAKLVKELGQSSLYADG